MNPDFSLSDWMKNWGTLNLDITQPVAGVERGASGASGGLPASIRHRALKPPVGRGLDATR